MPLVISIREVRGGGRCQLWSMEMSDEKKMMVVQIVDIIRADCLKGLDLFSE